ncbi:MAG TPA: hypothetical protein VGB69_02620 [Edaphobacter sp.]
MSVACPECENPLELRDDELETGETVLCEECGTEFEVISTDPVELSAIDETGYDDEDLSALPLEDD